MRKLVIAGIHVGSGICNQVGDNLQKRIACIILSVLVCLACVGCAEGEGQYKDGYYVFNEEVFANGITFTATLRGGNEKAAFKEMKQFMAEVNAELSLSLSTSAITKFNDSTANDTVVEVSEFSYNIINTSLDVYNKTGGAFNIGVAALSTLWGVDTAGLDRHGLGAKIPQPPPAPPSIEKVNQLLATTNLSALSCYQDSGKYYIAKMNGALKIDVGAIAKGYSADQCVKIAKQHNITSALINISGNLCLIGKWFRPDYNNGEFDWAVGINRPRPRGGIFGEVCAVRVAEDCTIVTSGDYRRFYTYTYPDGKTLNVSHVIDGRTGLPMGVTYNQETGRYENTNSYVVSATVITSNSAYADAFATALCALSYDEGIAVLQQNGLRGILFTQDNAMALVGISQTENTGSYSLAYTSDGRYTAYKQYSIKEYAID